MHAHASLNRAYRLVWNAALAMFVVAPETARGGRGGTTAGRGDAAGSFALRRIAVALALGFGLQAGWALDAGALPQDGTLAAGNASWNASGSTMTVTQGSQRAIVNWGSFDVGAAAKVQIVQPSSSAVILNRVTGGSPSQVQGMLSANGQVYLVNPAGVLFGQGAQVDVGGLVASTLAIGNDDFLAGRDRFVREGATGAVVNEGRITVRHGGRVALLGARVDNRGQIVAPAGDVVLAAGQQVQLAVGANGHLQVAADAADVATLVSNGGLLQADGGQILLTAKGADALAAAVVSNTGTLQARTVDARQGRILLLADMEHGNAQVAGTLDASAPAGGDGGFVETSAARVTIAPDTRVTTAAPAGATGTWLIDPTDFTISTGSAAQTTSGIGAATLQANLATSNVQLLTSVAGAAAGNINVEADVRWSANRLTLTAHNDINIDAVMTASGTATLALDYGGTGGDNNLTPAAGSAIVTGPRGRVDFTGTGNALWINGNGYTILTALGAQGSTTGTDLQGVNGNLARRYALGADIDASATSGWGAGAGFTPLGNATTPFTGSFEGLGHVVHTLSINAPGATNVGLFGYVGSGATVGNVEVAGASVTGGTATGALAGYNAGTLRNVGASGSVNGAGQTGGLVGTNAAMVYRSWANTAVTSSNSIVGGLVGNNTAGATVAESWSRSNVLAYADYGGGLVGQNLGTISDSYAAGSITNGFASADYFGGLAGRVVASSVIERSYTTTQLPATLHRGGVVGFGTGTVAADVYWDSGATGAATGGGSGNALGTAATTAQLQSALPAGFASTTWGNLGATSTPYLLSNLGPVQIASDASGTLYQPVFDAAGLQAMGTSGKAGLTGSYVLAQDIDATATATWNGGLGFAPVGSPSGPFTGGFEGMGHTISGLTIARPAANGAGLFAATQGAALRNVDITGASVLAATDAAILAGIGGTGSTVEKVNVSGTVTAGVNTGGLLGSLAPGGSVDDSHAAVDVFSSSSGNVRSGGLVGTNRATITRSSATGRVDTPGAFAGGLVGSNLGSISDSWASGNVTSSGTGIYHGGLVGFNGGAIVSTYATGAVAGGGSQYGGLAGASSGTGSISQSWASGSVQQTGGDLAGGFVGTNDGAIVDSYALGAVQGGLAAGSYGGFVGFNGTGATIANVYATGTAIGLAPGTGGGIAGNNVGAISNAVSGSTGNTVAVETNAGTLNNVTLRTPSEMKQLATYTALGWDIDDAGGTGKTWRIYDGNTTPLLRGFLTPLTVSVDGALAGKTYDGTAASGSAGAASITLSDPAAVLSGSLSYATASKNAGTYTAGGGTLSFSGLYSGQLGYDIAYTGSASSTITPKDVTGAITAANKVYDGNTAASTSGALTGVLGADVVTLASTGTFADRNVGNGKTVTISGSALAGADAANYHLAGANATTTADITPKALTGTVTASNKVYDGNASATTSSLLAGVVGSDDVTLGTTGAFSDRNAAIAKTVTITGAALGGADAGNYTLTANTTTTADITPKALTATVIAADKVYDGTTTATTSGSLAGVIGADEVTLSTSGTFADKNAGSAKAVTISSTLGGADAGNYTVTPNATTADITPRALTGTVTAGNKVYDGNTTAATSTSLSGVIGSDAVTLSASGTFADRNVGVGKTVNIAGATLGGADAGNYTVTANATTAADITPLALTGTVTAANKVYDGGTAATTSGSLAGVIGTDAVTLATAGTFGDKNVGSGKTVTITGATLAGADAGNYTVTSNGTATADITPLAITGTVTAANKAYDGNTTATVSASLAGVIGADDVALSASGTFSDRNVGTGKTVSVGSVTVGGVDAGNYTVSTNASTTADITPKTLTGTVTAANKVYDGTTSAATSGALSGVVGTEAVTFTTAGAFSDKNAGTGKTVTITGATLGGADAANYTVASNATTTADITPKSITGTVTAVNKVYDGTTTASTAASLAGVVGSDAVTLSASGTFGDRNVGLAKTVAITGATLLGADAGNYTLTSNAATTADITPKSVTGTLTAANKVYDGTTSATTTGSLTGLVAGDAVTLAATGTFADRNAGTGKVVTLSGTGLAGADAGNYLLGAANTSTTADITPKTVTGTITAADKVYDGTTVAATSGSLGGVLAGDAVMLTTGGSFADRNAGTGKTVNVQGAISGVDAGNYALAANATTTATITPRPLTGSITAADKVYDGTTTAVTSGALAGVLAGDGVALATTGSFADPHAGQGKTVAVTGTLAGTDAGNYTVASNGATSANIAPAALTVTANDAAEIGDGVPFSGGNGVRYTGFVAGEGASVLGGTLAYVGSAQGAVQPGSYNIAVSGLFAADYSIAYRDGTLTILPAQGMPAAGDAARRAELVRASEGSPTLGSARARLTLAPDFLRVE